MMLNKQISLLKQVKNLYFLVPALIFLSVYWKSIFFGAVWGDDPLVISSQARDFNLMLKSFYDNSNYSGVHYLPFFYLQCFFVNKIFGGNAYPFGFHIYLLLAQSLVCIFATLTFFILTKNKPASVIAVTFCMLHPANVQISTRVLVGPGVMGFALCLAFIYLNLKALNHDSSIFKWIFIALANLFFLIALMTGESYFFYPCLLYLACFSLKGKNIFSKQYLYLIIPITIILPLYLTFRFIACGGNMFNSSTGNELLSWTEMGGIKDVLFRAIWFSPQLIVHYFKLFFWPFGLMDSKAEWYTVGDSLFSPYSLFCQFFVLLLIVSIFFLYKKFLLYSIGMLWFFISILLFIQIFPLFTIIGIRYMNVPSLGLVLALFGLILGSSNLGLRRLLFILFIPILIFFVTRTIYYLPSSKDHLTQWIYCAKEAPLWNKPTYFAKALALAQTEKREHELPKWLNEEAFVESTNEWLNKYLDLKAGLAIEYGPMQMAYNFNVLRGRLKFLFYTDQSEKTNKVLKLILRIDNGQMGWYEIAKFLHDTERWKGAWEALKIAISKAPSFKNSYDDKFIEIAIQAGKTDEAEQVVKNYINFNKNFSYPYLVAGQFYLKQGKTQDALNNFRIAIQKDKKISINENFLYLTAASLFIDNNFRDDANQVLSTILSYDPFDISAQKMLNELNSLSMVE